MPRLLGQQVGAGLGGFQRGDLVGQLLYIGGLEDRGIAHHAGDAADVGPMAGVPQNTASAQTRPNCSRQKG
jgi:hypothetical protein